MNESQVRTRIEEIQIYCGILIYFDTKADDSSNIFKSQ